MAKQTDLQLPFGIKESANIFHSLQILKSEVHLLHPEYRSDLIFMITYLLSDSTIHNIGGIWATITEFVEQAKSVQLSSKTESIQPHFLAIRAQLRDPRGMKSIREEFRMSKTGFAQLIRAKQPYITDWENGKYKDRTLEPKLSSYTLLVKLHMLKIISRLKS